MRKILLFLITLTYLFANAQYTTTYVDEYTNSLVKISNDTITMIIGNSGIKSGASVYHGKFKCDGKNIILEDNLFLRNNAEIIKEKTNEPGVQIVLYEYDYFNYNDDSYIKAMTGNVTINDASPISSNNIKLVNGEVCIPYYVISQANDNIVDVHIRGSHFYTIQRLLLENNTRYIIKEKYAHCKPFAVYGSKIKYKKKRKEIIINDIYSSYYPIILPKTDYMCRSMSYINQTGSNIIDIDSITKQTLEFSRNFYANELNENCKYFLRKIKPYKDNGIVGNVELLSESEVSDELNSIYDNLYEVVFSVYKLYEDFTVIDVQYQLKSSLKKNYRKRVQNFIPLVYIKTLPLMVTKESEKINFDDIHCLFNDDINFIE